jgi:peptide-methionine (S)-S-oxide reductase
MRFLLAILALILTPAAFAQKTEQAPTQQAVFAGGCFWCMESDMQGLPGVISVESGYTGGAERHPKYKDVARQQTGHYEAVRVTFDPAKMTYEQLLTRFWPLIDPTDDGGQFCDRGRSYLPAIFVTPDQKAAAQASKQKIIASGRVNGEVKVPILPLGEFWPAEEEHRNFAKRNADYYAAYRRGCQRDVILRQVWKPVS